MDGQVGACELMLGGRQVVDVRERVRRYCGLRWSGGPPETWAYRYYDEIVTDPARVGPVDVLAAGALHPGLSRNDLTYFDSHGSMLDAWLELLPVSLHLEEATEDLIGHLERVAAWPDAPQLSLLTKVLHRKRPALIPLVDRHVLDWYRPVTGERGANAAWPKLLRCMRGDLRTNADPLAVMKTELEHDLDHAPTALRQVDIAVWMGAK